MANESSSYSGLSVWDYVVLGVFLFISAAIGVYFRFAGGKQKSTKVYNSFHCKKREKKLNTFPMGIISGIFTSRR